MPLSYAGHTAVKKSLLSLFTGKLVFPGDLSKFHFTLNNDRKILLAAESVTVSAIQLFELLPEHPVISTPLVTRLLDTTKPTAGKAIELLRQNGILREMGDRKRDRIYCYSLYLDILTN